MNLFKKIKNSSKRKQISVKDMSLAFPNWDLVEDTRLVQKWTKNEEIRSLVFYPIPANVPFNISDEKSAQEYYTKLSASKNVTLDFCDLGYIGHVRSLSTVISREDEGYTQVLGSYTFYFVGFSFVLKWEKKLQDKEAEMPGFLEQHKELDKDLRYSDFLKGFYSF
jgi:hypothetical protein